MERLYGRKKQTKSRRKATSKTSKTSNVMGTDKSEGIKV
jgi:hypothetical protein